MGNPPFEDVSPKKVVFHCYVALPEGTLDHPVFFGGAQKNATGNSSTKNHSADKVVAVPGKSETYFIESMECLGTKRDGDLLVFLGMFFFGK